MNTQAIPQTEVTWKIYEGDIEIIWNWKYPVSSLKACRFCKKEHLLQYPKECDRGGLTKACIHHPCLFCGEEDPGHVPMDCEMKADESYEGNLVALFQQCIQFQKALAHQKICYIYCEPEIMDRHVEKCLNSLLQQASQGSKSHSFYFPLHWK